MKIRYHFNFYKANFTNNGIFLVKGLYKIHIYLFIYLFIEIYEISKILQKLHKC